MGTPADVVAWCRAQIGHVGGGTYWKDVYGYWSEADWCAIFDSDAYKQTDTECAYWPNAVVFDESDKGIIGDAWVDPYELQPGDSIGYSWRTSRRGDHVGIVESVEGYGCYYTIEGNCSNEVKRKYRTVWDDGIIGGIRPKWNGGEETLYDFDDVQLGSTGNAVSMCQSALNIRNNAGLYVDGWCGELTDKAIRDFQQKKGLYVDGWCGEKTWRKLLTQ